MEIVTMTVSWNSTLMKDPGLKLDNWNMEDPHMEPVLWVSTILSIIAISWIFILTKYIWPLHLPGLEKIRFGEQFLHHGIFNNNIQHIIRKQIFTKIVNKVCPNKNDSVKSCQILLRHFFVHIIIHVFHRLNFLDPQPLSPSGARKCFHFSNCLWCCDGPVLTRMVACQRPVHQH